MESQKEQLKHCNYADPRDVREKFEQLAMLCGARDWVKPILDSDNFFEWPGSSTSRYHHYFRGGLAQHSFEVFAGATGLLKAFDFAQISDYDVHKIVFTICVWHDFGKTNDYNLIKDSSGDTYVEDTEHKKMFYHLSRSALEWEKYAAIHLIPKKLISKEDADRVTHGILAHHGQREWGSPVSPQTPEAWAVHLADNFSARVSPIVNSLAAKA